MPSKADHAKLQLYNKELRRKSRPFPCRSCGVAVSAVDYEGHCSVKHGLNSKRCCVWCSGEFGWKSREKCLNADHLMTCFRKFYNAVDDSNERSSSSRYSDYRKELKRKNRRFDCPRCDLSVVPAEFEAHCDEFHDLDSELCCVWCDGREKWSSGERNVNHVVCCFRRFLALLRDDDEIVVSDPRLTRTDPMCEPRCFFGHEDLREKLPPEAFEPFRVLDHENRVRYFRDENLNVAASYLRLYAETSDSSDWMHVTVKAVAFESFLDAVSNDGTKILLHSCWCDGGDENLEPVYRQHRHMVAVRSPKNGFAKSVWNGVGASERPLGVRFQSKSMQKIKSSMHLANVLGYVSRRESRCSFDSNNRRPLKNKHFYVFAAMPVDFLLPLCVQWEGGLKSMLFQEKYQNVSVGNLKRNQETLEFLDSRWKQKIKHFYGFEKGWVSRNVTRRYADRLPISCI